MKKCRPKLIGIKKKVERREARREIKAEAAARLEVSIEKELLARLKDGTYGDMYNDIVNVNNKAFEHVMDNMEEEEVEEGEYEFVEDDSASEWLSDMEEELELEVSFSLK